MIIKFVVLFYGIESVHIVILLFYITNVRLRVIKVEIAGKKYNKKRILCNSFCFSALFQAQFFLNTAQKSKK